MICGVYSEVAEMKQRFKIQDYIEGIYGDSFLDITDLNQLPTKLTGVVKRHIRV